MHKEQKKLKIDKRTQKQSVVISSWKKYLLAPIVLAGALVISTALKEEAKESFILNGVTYSIPKKEVKEEIITSCCKLLVLDKESDFFIKFAKGEKGGMSLGPVKYADGTIKAFLLIQERALGTESLQNKIAQGFSEENRKRIKELARGNTISEVTDFSNSLTAESLVSTSEQKKAYEYIVGKGGERLGKEFLKRLATACLVGEIFALRATNRERGFLVDVAVHETTHGTQDIYDMIKLGLTKQKRSNHYELEVFAYLAAIAYGESPWVAIDTLFGYAVLKYLNKPFVHLGVNMYDKRASVEMIDDTYKMIIELVKELGITELVELKLKDENQLREAAKRVLDKEAQKLYGTNFEEIVPLKGLTEIREAVRKYWDNKK